MKMLTLLCGLLALAACASDPLDLGTTPREPPVKCTERASGDCVEWDLPPRDDAQRGR